MPCRWLVWVPQRRNRWISKGRADDAAELLAELLGQLPHASSLLASGMERTSVGPSIVAMLLRGRRVKVVLQDPHPFPGQLYGELVYSLRTAADCLAGSEEAMGLADLMLLTYTEPCGCLMAAKQPLRIRVPS